MGIIEWDVLLIIAILKLVLIIYGILGFSVNKSKWKYFFLILLTVNWIIFIHVRKSIVEFRTLWEMLFVIVFFEGKITKKIQCYILVYILLAITELFIWAVGVVINPMNNSSIIFNISYVAEIIGLVFWFVLFIILRKKRNNIYQIFMQLEFRHYISIIFILFGLGLIGGTVQYSLLEDTSEDIRKFSLVLDMLVTFLIFIGCLVFVYSVYMKKKVEMENKLNEERLIFQKNHYDTVIKKDEGIRQFRHDMRKHMRAISALCDAGNVEEVKQYVSKLSDAYQENEVVHTGNIVSDYFLNATIDELVKEKDIEFEYYIQGKFPDIMNINNNDLCVVMANALENAQHAMKRKKGKCRLFLEIKNNNGRLYIQIANSALPDEMEHLQRGKRDGHGYGTFNMRQVVEKYDGEIQFLYEEGMFIVKISIN